MWKERESMNNKKETWRKNRLNVQQENNNRKFTMELARVRILLQYTIEIPKKERKKKTPRT